MAEQIVGYTSGAQNMTFSGKCVKEMGAARIVSSYTALVKQYLSASMHKCLKRIAVPPALELDFSDGQNV